MPSKLGLSYNEDGAMPRLIFNTWLCDKIYSTVFVAEDVVFYSGVSIYQQFQTNDE